MSVLYWQWYAAGETEFKTLKVKLSLGCPDVFDTECITLASKAREYSEILWLQNHM